MVDGQRRSRRRSGRLLGNHQKCWIWGRNLVRETLDAGVWASFVVHADLELGEAPREWLEKRTDELGLPLHWESADRLRQICGSGDHQGFVAGMLDFPYTAEDGLDAIALHPESRLVVCDRIQDPFNFGAIIRSAEALGFSGILIGRSGQVGVTSHVARASAGAVNHLPIIRCESLRESLGRLRSHGMTCLAATEKSERALGQSELHPPLAVLIGNEGYGSSPDLLTCCDLTVRIPVPGKTQSLNAAVAAGIILYEAVRRNA